MGFNHTLRPSEGGTVTRAAPCRAPLRRWERRAVAHEQGAPRFRTRTAGWDLGGPSLATCLSAQSNPKETFVAAIERRGTTLSGRFRSRWWKRILKGPAGFSTEGPTGNERKDAVLPVRSSLRCAVVDSFP